MMDSTQIWISTQAGQGLIIRIIIVSSAMTVTRRWQKWGSCIKNKMIWYSNWLNHNRNNRPILLIHPRCPNNLKYPQARLSKASTILNKTLTPSNSRCSNNSSCNLSKCNHPLQCITHLLLNLTMRHHHTICTLPPCMECTLSHSLHSFNPGRVASTLHLQWWTITQQVVLS